MEQGQSNTKKAGRGGRRNRSEQFPDVRISRALSTTLRHNAVKEGLAIDGGGWVNVGELLQLNKFRSQHLTLPIIQRIVSESDKQRFALAPLPTAPPASTSPADYLIRATQGHSIPLSSEALQLEPLLPSAADFPAEIVHGTFYPAYEQIIESGGLNRMGRTHIHFSDHEKWKAGGVISGMRKDAKVVFFVDAKRLVEEGGVKLWRSSNGVVLSEGDESGTVGLKWVKRVEDLGEDSGEKRVLWEDGEKKRELPEKLKKGGPPRGKGFLKKGQRGGGAVGRGKGGGKDVNGEAKQETTGIEAAEDTMKQLSL